MAMGSDWLFCCCRLCMISFTSKVRDYRRMASGAWWVSRKRASMLMAILRDWDKQVFGNRSQAYFYLTSFSKSVRETPTIQINFAINMQILKWVLNNGLFIYECPMGCSYGWIIVSATANLRCSYVRNCPFSGLCLTQKHLGSWLDSSFRVIGIPLAAIGYNYTLPPEDGSVTKSRNFSYIKRSLPQTVDNAQHETTFQRLSRSQTVQLL